MKVTQKQFEDLKEWKQRIEGKQYIELSKTEEVFLAILEPLIAVAEVIPEPLDVGEGYRRLDIKKDVKLCGDEWSKDDGKNWTKVNETKPAFELVVVGFINNFIYRRKLNVYAPGQVLSSSLG